MSKTIISTPHAPAALGPYSQGVKVGHLIYTAGQLGLDPATGKLVDGLEAQTEQALRNLAAILEAAGSRMENVVKTTCFLADIADFKAFNGVYARFFASNPPARSTIQAGALPADARVEIEVVAFVE
ncbi:RidA family protein [Candidatus Amarolinea dominans]|uniref:RidA family protein n=1 Tax=Candidatus Amarolinea dominans TaxID=3140696 RepID=UPI001D22A6E3|nr:RidA family protein [Anaerolineae bacterium]MBK7203857.1 RidA family protein [Anaerolineae bacterium]MBK9091645.1 RidA family protein [Anaerolineae bacterium]MBK9230270.1 RidA family protein [Anaerolineae bacterium]